MSKKRKNIHLVSKKQDAAHVIFIMIKGMKIRARQMDRTIFRITIFDLMSCWNKIDIVHNFERFKIQKVPSKDVDIRPRTRKII